MTELYIQTSGDFNEFDPMLREEAREDFFRLLERHKHAFRELNLHAHVKRLSSRLGNQALVRCSLNLFTDKGRFHATEEAFGLDAAVRSALLGLRFQVERFQEMRQEQRHPVGMEG